MSQTRVIALALAATLAATSAFAETQAHKKRRLARQPVRTSQTQPASSGEAGTSALRSAPTGGERGPSATQGGTDTNLSRGGQILPGSPSQGGGTGGSSR